MQYIETQGVDLFGEVTTTTTITSTTTRPTTKFAVLMKACYRTCEGKCRT